MPALISAIHDGIARLRTKWPQAHYCPGKHGDYLIVVPGVVLPKGYVQTICTVLFIAPPGFPAACPDHFFTDIEIRLEDKSIPKATVIEGNFRHPSFPQWWESMWWSWHLQMWDPNRSGLFTYMKVIQQRLNPAR